MAKNVDIEINGGVIAFFVCLCVFLIFALYLNRHSEVRIAEIELENNKVLLQLQDDPCSVEME